MSVACVSPCLEPHTMFKGYLKLFALSIWWFLHDLLLTGKIRMLLVTYIILALNSVFIVILKSSTVGEPKRVCASVSKGHSCPPKCPLTSWVMVGRFISVAFQRKVLLVSDQLRTTSGVRQRIPACKFCLERVQRPVENNRALRWYKHRSSPVVTAPGRQSWGIPPSLLD